VFLARRVPGAIKPPPFSQLSAHFRAQGTKFISPHTQFTNPSRPILNPQQSAFLAITGSGFLRRNMPAEYNLEAPPKEVGETIPADCVHAVSVTLPTWDSNVAYEEGKEWVLSKLKTGYPR
jgi:hypothetical protein